MAIYFGENAKSPFAKVWKVEDKGKFVKAQISTSKKNQDGTYENSSWFASFLGKCVDDARQLERGDSIKITSGTISVSKGSDDKSYTNIAIFAFEKPEFEQKPKATKSAPVEDSFYQVNDDDGDLPF